MVDFDLIPEEIKKSQTNQKKKERNSVLDHNIYNILTSGKVLIALIKAKANITCP